MLWSYVFNLTDIRLPCIKFLTTRMVGGGGRTYDKKWFSTSQRGPKNYDCYHGQSDNISVLFFYSVVFCKWFLSLFKPQCFRYLMTPPLFQEHSTFFRIGWKSARTIVTPFGDRIFFGLEDFSLRSIWCIRDKDK